MVRRVRVVVIIIIILISPPICVARFFPPFLSFLSIYRYGRNGFASFFHLRDSGKEEKGTIRKGSRGRVRGGTVRDRKGESEGERGEQGEGEERSKKVTRVWRIWDIIGQRQSGAVKSEKIVALKHTSGPRTAGSEASAWLAGRPKQATPQFSVTKQHSVTFRKSIYKAYTYPNFLPVKQASIVLWSCKNKTLFFLGSKENIKGIPRVLANETPRETPINDSRGRSEASRPIIED